jgi:aminoglycoside phosphotransferase (APT) family kinase protein
VTEKGEELTAEQAKAFISSSFPEFNGAQVSLLDEGWDFRVFEIDTRWLFRFPKRKVGGTKLKMEHTLLSDLKDWLPLPVPDYEYYNESCTYTGLPFAGYLKLAGLPGDISKMFELVRVSQQLGNFLGMLHAYPIDKAREAGVQEYCDSVTYWAKKSSEQLSSLTHLHVDTERLRRYIVDNIPGSV